MLPSRAELIDLAKRAGWTALQAGGAVFVAAPQVTDVDELRALAFAVLAAAIAAAASIVKSYIAQRFARRRAR